MVIDLTTPDKSSSSENTTVPRRPKNYVRELEAKFPDESSARKAMEEFAGCSMRSKGGEYCIKGGARIRRYVCTFANKRGWTSCDFAARTVQSPRSGRFTVEAVSAPHLPHTRLFQAFPQQSYARSSSSADADVAKDKPKANDSQLQHDISKDGELYRPLKSLVTGLKEEWTVKVRVVERTSRRTFHKARVGADGEFFSMQLVDSEGGWIKAVCWDKACAEFSPKIKPGKVYLIRSGRGIAIKAAHKSFNPDGAFELSINSPSVRIEDAQDCHLPTSIYKLRDIASIPALASEGRTRVDVCGVVIQEGADHGANASRGTNIMIEDQTGVIQVTGWAQRGGIEASQTLLLIGNAKIISSSQIDETPPVLAVDSGAEVKVNPTHPCINELHGWLSTVDSHGTGC